MLIATGRPGSECLARTLHEVWNRDGRPLTLLLFSPFSRLEKHHAVQIPHLEKIEGTGIQEHERDEGSDPAGIVDARDHLFKGAMEQVGIARIRMLSLQHEKKEKHMGCHAQRLVVVITCTASSCSHHLDIPELYPVVAVVDEVRNGGDS